MGVRGDDEHEASDVDDNTIHCANLLQHVHTLANEVDAHAANAAAAMAVAEAERHRGLASLAREDPCGAGVSE